MENLPAKLLVVDDHQVIGELLDNFFSVSDEYRIYFVVSSISEAKQILKQNKIDICIIDLSLEDEDGIELINYIKKEHPSIKTLVFTMHISSIMISEALSSGVDAYVPKSSTLDELKSALDEISQDKKYFSIEVTNRLIDGLSDVKLKHQSEGRASKLTKRENQILQEVLNGKPNKAIANELNISLRTVENHRANILRKMDVNNFFSLLYLKK